jgi:nucleoside-diphosphate-sugar epimerase
VPLEVTTLAGLDAHVAMRLAAGSQRIIITGASGWLGMATLELLSKCLGSEMAQRVVCFGSSPRELVLRDGTRVSQRALGELGDLVAQDSWLLHFAFLTKDRAEMMDEASYRSANTAIREIVVAALDKIGVEAVFVASSGAAAKALDGQAAPAMRLYGELKLMDEAAFSDWAERSGHRAVIGRIYNITGPYINKHGAYAIASFITDALAGRTISVTASRAVVRSNVAIRQLMSLVFALLDGVDGPVMRFDSGGTPAELEDIATLVCTCLGGNGVDRAAITNDMPDLYFGNFTEYGEITKAYKISDVSIEQQILETADYMKFCIN